jgi:hypothetical protein
MTTRMQKLLARVDGITETIEPSTIFAAATPTTSRRAEERRRAARTARQTAVVRCVRALDPAVTALLVCEPGECHDDLLAAGLL